jgi:hypothetical protein
MLLMAILLRSGVLREIQFDRLTALHHPIRLGTGGAVYRTSRSESQYQGKRLKNGAKGSFLLCVSCIPS